LLQHERVTNVDNVIRDMAHHFQSRALLTMRLCRVLESAVMWKAGESLLASSTPNDCRPRKRGDGERSPMSALPPKADIVDGGGNVPFVSKPAVSNRSKFSVGEVPPLGP
jgi:hypothetical protein